MARTIGKRHPLKDHWLPHGAAANCVCSWGSLLQGETHDVRRGDHALELRDDRIRMDGEWDATDNGQSVRSGHVARFCYTSTMSGNQFKHSGGADRELNAGANESA